MKDRYTPTCTSYLFFLTVFFLFANNIYAQTGSDQPPTFTGGKSKLVDFINEYMIYPQQAFYDSIGGVVVVGFEVDNKGMLKDFRVSRPVVPALDSEALRVITLLSQVLPKWDPGKRDGIAADMKDSLEVTFDILAYEHARQQDHLDRSPSPGFVVPKFIKDNLSYPATARANNIEGRVLVKFVINEDGSIGDVQVVHGIGSGCDEEAINVIKKMPKWSPAIQHGKPVKVDFTMPVQFSLH